MTAMETVIVFSEAWLSAMIMADGEEELVFFTSTADLLRFPQAIVISELGVRLSKAFSEFEAKPLAAASVPLIDQAANVADAQAPQVQRFAETGVDELILVMQMGTVPHEVVMRSIRVFADKVMPHFIHHLAFLILASSLQLLLQ